VQEAQVLLDQGYQDYTIMISEGVYTDVQKRSEFVNFAEVCAMMGIKPPVKLMLSKAPIQATDELIEALEQQEKSAQESQAQELSLKLALVQAEIKKVNAQALEQLNMAASHHGRAESYVGLAHERNSQVSKNISTASKNSAEALVKLTPLIEKYGINNIERLLFELNSQETKKIPTENINVPIETSIPSPSMGSEGERSRGEVFQEGESPAIDGGGSNLQG
jgi:hypothetical protein